jgi:osmotically inducible protein OsmC
MASKASAVWTGSLKEGKGTISTATGVLSNANYSFATRFEGADSGTTPEELIAAAHASCFSMALGAQLGGAGLTPDKIETHAAVTLAKTDAGFAITKIALTTTASVPGATKEAFDKAASDAKAGCPISKLFANNTEADLESSQSGSQAILRTHPRRTSENWRRGGMGAAYCHAQPHIAQPPLLKRD